MEQVRIGNVEEKSDVDQALHHAGHSISAITLCNENLSPHDEPEMKARAVELIRRLMEFATMLEKKLPPNRRAESR